VDWAAVRPDRPTEIKFKDKKHLRPHQKEAHDKVIAGLKAADRGKLIMACGTGKTFTSLRIAETMAPAGGCVLFLVPSISLISQSVAEWAAEAEAKFSFFAVCSDPRAGQTGEEEDISTHDLAFPAHTKPKLLGHQIEALRKIRKKNVTVIFSTYQSIEVVQESQDFGTPAFDLVICDEAHRTTGIERTEYDKAGASAFVLVHKPDFIKAKKRLYMTATPRIYDDVSKGKAKDADIVLYSMDDPSVYGEELYRLDFSEAVRRGLLSDYKVMVLAVDEKHVSKAFQSQIADRNKELNLDDVIKIVGCYNGLQKKILPVDGDGAAVMDQTPMRRAVAFSRSIKDSKKITELFEGIVKKYVGEKAAGSEEAEEGKYLRCEVDHVDGTHNALIRNKRLQWLKEDTTKNGNVCRILSNARCLSEGVNVPALDAVMFLNPRNSVVDVVQSVGRVMRKVEGKQYGYIILPVGIPADMSPEEALADNQKYKVVWQVLQALRAHDDRFNAMINQIDINKQRPGQIQIIGVGENKEGEKGQGAGGNVQTVFNFPTWKNGGTPSLQRL
jgi:predicted helicase